MRLNSSEESEPVEELAQPPIPECIKPETQEPVEPVAEMEPEPEPEPEPVKKTKAKAGFSAKLFESLASVGGFYGGSAQVEPVIPVVPFEEDEAAERSRLPRLSRSRLPLWRMSRSRLPVVEDEPVEAAVVEEDVIEPTVADYEPTEPPVAFEEVAFEESGEPVQAEQFDGPMERPMHGMLAEIQAKADEARAGQAAQQRGTL